MDQKYGIEQLKVIANALGAAIVAVDKLSRGNLFGVLGLAQDFYALGKVDFAQVKSEIAELSADERAQLLAAVKGKVSLQNPAVEAKVDAGFDLLGEAVDLGYEVAVEVEKVLALYNKATALVA